MKIVGGNAVQVHSFIAIFRLVLELLTEFRNLKKGIPMVTYVRTLIRHFVADETGATAIEYGLIAALVAVAAVTALTTVGTNLTTTFTTVAGKL
jgi:pilus assembly protein Flp/PilA